MINFLYINFFLLKFEKVTRPGEVNRKFEFVWPNKEHEIPKNKFFINNEARKINYHFLLSAEQSLKILKNIRYIRNANYNLVLFPLYL